jgi:hypothetical protein
MTTNDIEKLQIVATTTEGEYLLTTSSSRALIDLVAAMCEFHKVKKELFEEYSLTELTDGQDFASDN